MSAAERDESLRTACFARLDLLRASFGDDIPYRGGLDEGFPFRGSRVPFLSPQKGIFRASAQSGPAPLSIQTSFNSPYEDAELDEGFRYDYRAGSVDQPDNRALRSAFLLRTPMVYFVATQPGRYRAIYPCFVEADDPVARLVVVGPGRMMGALDEPEATPIDDAIERRYAVRETRIRLHQARFRGRVLIAYRNSCAVCRLQEMQLLDAAHIVSDSSPYGEPVVSNGLSLCSIHHRAFDQDLVGISPGYEVHVSRRLLEDDDGPMLELLKTFHGQRIVLPTRIVWRPNQQQLAERFDRFAAA